MTYSFSHFPLSDVVSLCAGLSEVGRRAETMEDAARAVVRHLRLGFTDPGTGTPEIVLARCFQTVRMDALPAELREPAAAALPAGTRDDVRCLTLLGTDGDLPEWRDRRRSFAHRAIPLPSAEAVADAPMIAGLVEQLGVGLDTFLGGADGDGTLVRDDFDVFHVPDAAAAPQVPAKDFVHEHGVRSALGFGGVLPGGDVFTVVLFTRTPVGARTAHLFRTVAVAAKLALLPALTRPLFAGGPERPVAPELVAQARVSALQQMLSVQQKTVADQANRLEQALHRAEQEAHSTDSLREIGTILGADLDLGRIVQAATEASTRVTGAAFGAFFYNTVDASGELLTLYTLAGAPRSAFEAFPTPRNTAVFEPTFRGTGIVRSADITRDPRYGHNAPHYGLPAGHLPVRSYLAVPVTSRRGTVHGGLFFGHPEAGVFDGRAEHLAVGIAAQTALALDNAHLYEQQRRVAVELQHSLLPHDLPSLEGCELAHRYLPGWGGADVGGDWFDAIELGGGRLALVIGDVMGRGVHAAAIMGQLRTAVRAYAVIDLPPGELLGRLNQLVCDMGSDLIATCIYVVYDQGDQVLTVANAGHPPPVFQDADGHAHLLPLPADPPLGLPNAVYREHDVHLPVDARLLLYTDGLVEDRSRSLDQGLRELLARFGDNHRSLDLLCKDLSTALLDPEAPGDDVTILAVRNTGSRFPRVSRPFSADHRSPSWARAFTGKTLAEWDVDVDVDTVAGAVHELVANSVVHAATDVTVRLRLTAGGVLAEVADADPHLPRLRPHDSSSERHRGLHVVAAQSTRWGARPTRTGKVVWAEFSD